MLGKTSLIRPAWRPAGAHASRHAPWTSHVHVGRLESLSAPETHGKQGISLHDTPRSVDSIEVPATEMVLDLKQIVSTHIVFIECIQDQLHDLPDKLRRDIISCANRGFDDDQHLMNSVHSWLKDRSLELSVLPGRKRGYATGKIKQCSRLGPEPDWAMAALAGCGQRQVI